MEQVQESVHLYVLSVVFVAMVIEIKLYFSAKYYNTCSNNFT